MPGSPTGQIDASRVAITAYQGGGKLGSAFPGKPYTKSAETRRGKGNGGAGKQWVDVVKPGAFMF